MRSKQRLSTKTSWRERKQRRLNDQRLPLLKREIDQNRIKGLNQEEAQKLKL